MKTLVSFRKCSRKSFGKASDLDSDLLLGTGAISLDPERLSMQPVEAVVIPQMWEAPAI
jgi:hypothetical protein